MNIFQRPQSIVEVSERILAGEKAGIAIKDFLHEFKLKGNFGMLEIPPLPLKGKADRGEMLDAYLQAMAVYLSPKTERDPPSWTWPPIQLKDPWFASPGPAIRNYLLISSPAPFRTRNLFIDEDSLTVY